ncbi:hypothetical protein PsorP6_002342 [Peronosclerospora sorghi]|uniref:Uncharacterized protein n=1 Tax=Peronosclerospora sorghi TaxID=230839 RepID=A0ACC0WRH7_9STRA|nr:hypothetical protein PsorP6_002342 [Peronosclerospora sorghi]
MVTIPTATLPSCLAEAVVSSAVRPMRFRVRAALDVKVESFFSVGVDVSPPCRGAAAVVVVTIFGWGVPFRDGRTELRLTLRPS